MFLKLISIFFLIFLSALFVAAEFAFVKVRSTRIEQLISEGSKRAMNVQKILVNLDAYLSATQLGITMVSLIIGLLGEPTAAAILTPLLSKSGLSESAVHVLSFVLAFSAVTFVHVVMGELAPKSIGIQKAEKVALGFAGGLLMFRKIAYPFIWALSSSARALTSFFGIKPASEHGDSHSEDELRIILSESHNQGEISASEYKYLNRIFEFDEKLAREIMIPRVDMMALDQNAELDEMYEKIKKERYTRFPIANGTKDEIVGMINTKDFFEKYIESNKTFNLSDIARPVISIPETTPIRILLRTMQEKLSPIAILIDEYGGTSGLVTMEDILEEIVGEIRDEFDGDEKPSIEHLSEHVIVAAGKVLITEINDLLNLSLDSEDYDTIGGLIMSENADLSANETIERGDVKFTIVERDNTRYKRIKIEKTQAS